MSKHSKLTALYSGLMVLTVAFSAIMLPGCEEEEGEIKIGAILPLTGSPAEFGNDQRNGMLLALEDLSKLGKRPKLVIVFEDSKGDPKEGVNAIHKLLVYNTLVVFSTMSSVSMAIAPITEENEVVLMTVAGHPELTSGRKFTIRMFPTTAYQVKELARFITERMKTPTMGVLYINDDLGNSEKEEFTKEYRRLGGKVLMTGSFEKEASDFRTEITKVLAHKPDALFLAGYGKELGLLTRQIRELGFKGRLFSTPEFPFPDVLTAAGDAAEGVIFTAVFIDDTKEEVNNFHARYRATYHKEPSLDSYLGYDEVMMTMKAIESSQTSGTLLRDELFKIEDFEGLTGNITVMPNGDVKFPLVLKTISNGQPMVLSE